MIADFQACSFLDFPGRLAAVGFSQGCNLRCRYCHNPALCARRAPDPSIAERMFALLAKRRGRLTGVVVCGGEPTLWSGLPGLLARIRRTGMASKLDSNGTRPQRVATLIGADLLDYLAVDLKAAPGESSRWLCGDARQGEAALASLAAAVRRGVPCEASTVLVQGVHDRAAMTWMAERLLAHGVRRWRLRKLELGRTLDASTPLRPPDAALIQDLLDVAKQRGLDAEWVGSG